jgi:hypothetical protein
VVYKKSKSPDITETTIYDLTGRSSDYYDLETYAFDVALGGLPFLFNITDTVPYRRSTARWKYERVDQAREPGEQTLDSGLWVRSQTSWHLGAGIQYQEALEGNPDLLRFRYFTSVGIDPWTTGDLSLLKDTSKLYNVTSTSSTAKTIALPATLGGTDYVLAINCTSTSTSTSAIRVSKVTAAGSATTVLTGANISAEILAAETDGSSLYLATADYIYDIDLTAGSPTLHSHYHISSIASASSVTLKFVKNRLLAGITFASGSTIAGVYELTFSGGHAGAASNLSSVTAIANTTTVPIGWKWTGVADGRGAIYISGYAGDKSSIFKIQPDATTGNLGPAISVADIPLGETVRTIFGYLGTYLAIGTSRGVRIAAIADDATIVYGPIIFETTSPITCFAARDSYIWAGVTNGVDGVSGTYRIYLGQLLEDGGYPYATDIYAASTTGSVDSVGFYPSTGQLFFSITASGVWIEHATNLVAEGTLTTAIVNWGTLEKKAWKRVRVEADSLEGNIEVYTESSDGRTQIVTLIEGNAYNTDYDITSGFSVPQVNGQLRFVLYRNTTDSTKGATLNGYAIKAIPSPTRSRLLQMPLMCYDFETDRRGVRYGVEGGAKLRLSDLELIETEGATVLVQDFTSGENFDAVIEEIAFTRMTPPSQNSDNFGGIITLPMRTIV